MAAQSVSSNFRAAQCTQAMAASNDKEKRRNLLTQLIISAQVESMSHPNDFFFDVR
jgi:hypothetical protein